MPHSYPDPWVPRTFSTWIKKHSTAERAVDRSGATQRRRVDCWDLEGRADGVQWLKRFRRAGLAQTWNERLASDFAAGLPFDLRTKQFVAPAPPDGADGPTIPSVFDLTELYFRQHPDWEPRTKVSAASSFNRARRHLLVPGAEVTSDVAEALGDYLDHASFLPDHLVGELTDRQHAGRAWLVGHSAPADSLTAAVIEAFVARFEVNQRNPAKRVSATTTIRFLHRSRRAGLGQSPGRICRSIATRG